MCASVLKTYSSSEMTSKSENRSQRYLSVSLYTLRLSQQQQLLIVVVRRRSRITHKPERLHLVYVHDGKFVHVSDPGVAAVGESTMSLESSENVPTPLTILSR
jgi:hypothetical protein